MALKDYKKEDLEKRFNHIENCAKMDAIMGVAEEASDTSKKIQQSIDTLIIGCRLAQEKGVYTLEEARTLMNVIDWLEKAKGTGLFY